MISLLLPVLAAAATPARVAVVVSAREGLPTEEGLRWSDADGDRVAAALIEVGGVLPEDLLRAPAATRESALAALEDARRRVAALESEGRETELIVYYTGHAGADGLHLHGETLALPDWKAAARAAGADRLLVTLDACQSGQLFRTQGVVRIGGEVLAPEFLPPPGEGWLASSGPEEWSFEADKRRGALFTHFFVTGLRGAADADADGSVTVAELAAFTAAQSAAAAASFGQLQAPRYAGDLDTLVLGSPGSASSGLRVRGPIPVPVLIVSRDDCAAGCAVVAEIPTGPGASVALPAGRWQLVAHDPITGLRAADVDLSPGEWAPVSLDVDLRPTPGVRSLGGALIVRPRAIELSAALTTAPAARLSPGFTAGFSRALGRGHGLALLATGTHGRFQNDLATGTTSRAIGSLEWRYDLYDGPTTLRGGLRAGGGVLWQDAARAPSGAWGAWYGERDAAVHLRLPELHARAQLTVSGGSGPIAWQVAAGWGIEQAGPDASPMAAVEIGARRSLAGAAR